MVLRNEYGPVYQPRVCVLATRANLDPGKLQRLIDELGVGLRVAELFHAKSHEALAHSAQMHSGFGTIRNRKSSGGSQRSDWFQSVTRLNEVACCMP